MSADREVPCDHKFIGSKACLKCGWVPPAEAIESRRTPMRLTPPPAGIKLTPPKNPSVDPELVREALGAEADREVPKILGVEMAPDMNGYHVSFGPLSCALIGHAPCFSAKVGGKYVVSGVATERAVAAIEREILAIRAAIPERKGER